MTQDTTLPKEVTGPLRRTAVAIVGFATFFCAWAVLAPLSTTVHLSGKIKSSRPTFELQHPYGGSIDQVLVARHDHVRKGQTILRMDMALEQEQLENLLNAKAIYEKENRVIEEILADKATTVASTEDVSASPYLVRLKQARMQSDLQNQNAHNLRKQSSALSNKITLSTEQLALMSARKTRLASLEKQGLIKRSEGEILQEQILIVQSEIEEDRAALASLHGDIEIAQSQARLVMLSLTEQLKSVWEDNIKRQQDVERQIAALRDQLRKSVVRSPVDGVVSDIHFEATGMYAAKGKTLVSLTQPLERPTVSFQVPVSQIDQLQSGMRGHLVLTSFPQRSVPKLKITLLAISPRATLDENNTPVFYEGIAEIDAESLAVLTDESQFKITEDMPAQLLIEAQQTTLASYLFNPVAAAFENAIQD